MTRGKQYEIVDQDRDKYRIIGDHGKRVWINHSYFYLGHVFVLQMTDWKFDDEITEWNFVEVTISLNNGSRRWCNVTTPEKLVEHFMNPMMDPPGFYMEHLIIMKSLDTATVDQTLKHLDSQGQLEKATIPLSVS